MSARPHGDRGRHAGSRGRPRVESGLATVDDWDHHWETYAAANERNPAQLYRQRVALDLVGREGNPARLLDVGSGQGELLKVAAQRWPAAELAGIEASGVGIAAGMERVPRARFVLRDLVRAESPPPDLARWATHAICSEVLEHLDDENAVLVSAAEFMAVGCRLIVTVPGGRMSAFDRHIGHRRHYSAELLRDVLAAAGLEVELVAGAGFPFFNLYRRLVIARGARVVDDVGADCDGRQAVMLRAGMLVFRLLFRLNVPSSRWGRQLVAVARVPSQ